MTKIINQTDSGSRPELINVLYVNTKETMEREERVKEVFIKEALVKTPFTDQKIKSLLRSKRSGRDAEQADREAGPSYMINVFMNSLSQNQWSLLATSSSETELAAASAADMDVRIAAELAVSDASSAQEAANDIAVAAAAAASDTSFSSDTSSTSGNTAGVLNKAQLAASLLPGDWPVFKSLSGSQRDIFVSLSPDRRRFFASLSSNEQRNFFMFSPSIQSRDFLLSLSSDEERNFFISLSPNRQVFFISLSPEQQRFFISLSPVQQSFFSALAPERQSALISLPPNQWRLLTFLPMEQWLLFVSLPPEQRSFFTSLPPVQRNFFASLSPVLRNFFTSLSPVQRDFFISLSSTQRYFLEVMVTAAESQRAQLQPNPSAIQELERYVNNMFPRAQLDVEDSLEAPHIQSVVTQLEQTRQLQRLPSLGYFANYIARASTDRERDIYIELLLVSNNGLAIDSIINHVRGYLNRAPDPQSFKARIKILVESNNVKVMQILYDDTKTEVSEELQALGLLVEHDAQQHVLPPLANPPVEEQSDDSSRQQARGEKRLHSDEGASSVDKQLKLSESSESSDSMDKASLENCLHSASTGRRYNPDGNDPGPDGSAPGPSRSRRNVVGEGCEFDEEDIKEFNEGEEEPNELRKIKINSDKFIEMIENPSMPEAKRAQLIALAAEVSEVSPVKGTSQERVMELVKGHRGLRYLETSSRISGMVMGGLMWKNMLADLYNGNYKGVAINAAFIASGPAAKGLGAIGSKLILNGRYVRFGKSLAFGAPFLMQAGTLGFVIYDLVEQIKHGGPDATVKIVADGLVIGLQGSEILIQGALATGFMEAGAFTAIYLPVAGIATVVIFVGTDIYMAVKQVEREDKLIHLTGDEKWSEGWRAFAGIGPGEKIGRLLNEKQSNNKWFADTIDYLKNNTDIQRYIRPTAREVKECHDVIERIHGQCQGFAGGSAYCSRDQNVKVNKCTDKLEIHPNNEVDLSEKVDDIRWSRTRPDATEGNLFCAPQGGDDGEVPPEGNIYRCDNAMGIEYTKERTGNITLIDLGDGHDRVEGFPDGNHIVVLGNGHKNIELGSGNDAFILNGSSTYGFIHGGEGINTLDSGSFVKHDTSSYIKLEGTRGTVSRSSYPYPDAVSKEFQLKIESIHQFLLRKDKQDIISIDAACDIRYIDARGGGIRDDLITIYEDANCQYEMQLKVRPYTSITNRSKNKESTFTYSVPAVSVEDYGDAVVSLNQGSHRFVLEYPLSHLHKLKKRGGKILVDLVRAGEKPCKKTGCIKDGSQLFRLAIFAHDTNNLSFNLSDNTTITIKENEFIAYQDTNLSVDDIIKDYSNVATRLGVFIRAYSQLTNESIFIGHDRHDILPNDPSRRSHLVGNGGENVFIITLDDKILDKNNLPNIPEVVLYDKDNQYLIDTVDLRKAIEKLEKDLGLKVQIKTRRIANSKDVTIELFSSTATGESKTLFTVRLKDAVKTNWHKRLQVNFKNVLMEFNGLDLKPLPLEFHNQDRIFIYPEAVEKNTVLKMLKKRGGIIFLYDREIIYLLVMY